MYGDQTVKATVILMLDTTLLLLELILPRQLKQELINANQVIGLPHIGLLLLMTTELLLTQESKTLVFQRNSFLETVKSSNAGILEFKN